MLSDDPSGQGGRGSGRERAAGGGLVRREERPVLASSCPRVLRVLAPSRPRVRTTQTPETETEKSSAAPTARPARFFVPLPRIVLTRPAAHCLLRALRRAAGHSRGRRGRRGRRVAPAPLARPSSSRGQVSAGVRKRARVRHPRARRPPFAVLRVCRRRRAWAGQPAAQAVRAMRGEPARVAHGGQHSLKRTLVGGVVSRGCHRSVCCHRWPTSQAACLPRHFGQPSAPSPRSQYCCCVRLAPCPLPASSMGLLG